MTEEIKKVKKPTVRIKKNTDTERDFENEAAQLQVELNKVMTKHIKEATKNSPVLVKKYIDTLNTLISKDISTSMVSAKMAITAHTLELLLPDLIDTLSMEAAKFNKQKLADSAKEVFNKEAKNIMLLLLGLTDKWGRLEVDNSSNRGSAITEYIKRNAEPILQEIVKEKMEEFKTTGVKEVKTKMSNVVLNGVKNQINSVVEYKIRDQISMAAQPIIDELIQEGLKKYDTEKAFRNIGSSDE